MANGDDIGGYFSLELPTNNATFLNSDGVLLNSGRNALEYIIGCISTIKCLWIPYYTCNVIMEPIRKTGIFYRYYHINEQLEIAEDLQLLPDEYLLITNYYGVKDQYVNSLIQKYGDRLIVDNAQAYYSLPVDGIKTFYSPRKFVGVPDGGIAYVDHELDLAMYEKDLSYDRCEYLLKRIDLGSEEGYLDCKASNRKLSNQPIKKMSDLTQKILESIDWERIKTIRLKNFEILNTALSETNNLFISSAKTFACPMIYPYFTSNPMLKNKLIENRIWVATYWPHVISKCKEQDFEYKLTEQMVAIPMDQRYNEIDMERIINVIMENI